MNRFVDSNELGIILIKLKLLLLYYYKYLSSLYYGFELIIIILLSIIIINNNIVINIIFFIINNNNNNIIKGSYDSSAQREGGVHDLHSFSQRLYAWIMITMTVVVIL